MAEERQRIQKVDRTSAVDFDEQQWPINLAIVILAAFVAGLVIATSDFQDSRLLHNGWARLIGVGISVGLLFWGVALLQGKMVRRLQLCIILSLLFHLWLSIYLHDQYLALMAEREAESTARLNEQYEEITVPDYHWEQLEEPQRQQEFEKPMETEAPKPTEPRAVRQEAKEPAVALDAKPVEEPEIPQRQQPNPAVVRRKELSAPRRADMAAGEQVSRQEWKHRPTPNEPIPDPVDKPRAQKAAAVPEPRIAPREYTAAEVRVDQRATFEESPSAQREQAVARMARRATQAEAIPDRPTTPTPTRQIREMAEVPRTEAAAPEPVEVARQQPQQVSPRPPGRTQVRRETTAPEQPQQSTEVAQTTPDAATPAASRQRSVEPVPRAARTPQPTPVRQPRVAAAPVESSPQAEAVVQTDTPKRPTPTIAQPQPPTRNVARTQTAPQPVPQERIAEPLPTPSEAVGHQTQRRSQTPQETVARRPSRRPARVSRPQAREVVAAVPVEQTSQVAETGGATRSDLPTLRPSSRQVRQEGAGRTRVVQQQSPGEALPTLSRAEQLPATTAARRTPTTRESVDAASAASPSTLARSIQGASLPSTVIPTEAPASSVPAAMGATAPSRVANVGPSAAVRREASQPDVGSVAAAAGAAELAVGSASLVARSGQPRATGADQPSTTSNSAASRIARSHPKAASVAASGVAEATVPATGKTSSEAEGPAVPSVNLQASAVKRGGTVQPEGQTATEGSGPAGASGTPGPIGVAQTSRVTRHESAEAAALSGGGNPRPSRQAGGATSPNATAESTQIAQGAPTGGKASQELPLEALQSGQRRELAGLPGSLQSQPAAGAEASLTSDGAPVASAAARRANAAGDPAAQQGTAAERTMTIAKRPAGLNIPAAANPTEDIAKKGAAGVALAQGGQLSKLPELDKSSVRQAASAAPQADATQAAGGEEAAIGDAPAVAMPGRTWTRGDNPPSEAPSVASRQIGRSGGPQRVVAGGVEVPSEPTETDVAASETAQPQTGEPESGLPSRASQAVARQAEPGEPSGQVAEVAEVDTAAALTEGGMLPAALPSRAEFEPGLAAASGASGLGKPSRRAATSEAAGAKVAMAEQVEPGSTARGPETSSQPPQFAGMASDQARQAGLPGSLIEKTAVESAMEVGPEATTPGLAAGERRLPKGEDSGSAVAAEVGGGPVRRSSVAGLPRGVAEVSEEVPVAAAAASRERGDQLQVAQATTLGSLSSRQEGGLPVQIAAPPGPGGLTEAPTSTVGLNSRRARPESEIVHTVARRFVIERSGGELAIDGTVREEPTEAYRQRDPGSRAQIAEAHGGTAGTERAVEMGLDFMARHQFPDGHWSLHELPPGLTYEDPGLGDMKSNTAGTGLALLSYLGAGYTHLDDKHRSVVDRGLDWLVRHQADNGDLFSNTGGSNYTWLYSHGIATIALCEAYGMTRDPQLREAARKAVDFVLQSQHPELGGWRYAPGKESDTSVTGWMLMALKSAQMAGLEVPSDALRKVDAMLDRAEVRRGQGLYAYNPEAKLPAAGRNRPQRASEGIRAGHAHRASTVMTAEAMLMRMYIGHRSDTRQMLNGANYLKANLPAIGTEAKPLRNCYYWYYGTQAMFQMQNDYWEVWNNRMRELLQAGQVQTGPAAGSWHPHKPVPDRWGHAGGRVYVTTMHLLMLEVYYRHLPLFQELRR